MGEVKKTQTSPISGNQLKTPIALPCGGVSLEGLDLSFQFHIFCMNAWNSLISKTNELEK